MKRWLTGPGAIVLLAAIVLSVAAPPAFAATPKLTLKAAKTSAKLGTTVKLSVTVVASTPAYEVWIYAKSGTAWKKIATAKLIAPGKYASSVKLKKKGKLYLKAAYVNSSRTVKAYSKIVTIKVL
jgi:hypothetical protein